MFIFLTQGNREDGEACCITMDKNDKHEIHAMSRESVTLCVFYPPLKGTENHDFSKGNMSAF